MMWVEAIVGAWGRVSRIAREQFVEQRCSGSPVAEDEHRSVTDWGFRDLLTVEQLLHKPERGLNDARRGNDRGLLPARTMNGESVASHEPPPGWEVVARPNGRRFCESADHGWGPPRG
jgi:hypothetical protein